MPKKGQEIDADLQIKDTLSWSAGAALSLLDPVAKFGLDAKDVREVNIHIGPGQRKYVLSLEHLEKLRAELASNTRSTLRFYKTRNQLDQCYLIMEVYEADSTSISINLNSSISAEAAVDKIKAVADASLKVSVGRTGEVVLTSTAPRLIGYKALKVNDTVFSDLVSPPKIGADYLTPTEAELIKK